MNKEQLLNKYQVFCDLDGVLVDLYQGVNDAIYADPPQDVSERYLKAQKLAKESLGGEILNEGHLSKSSEDFKKPVRAFMLRVMNSNRHFWMNLPWTDDGKKLWDFIKDYNPIILSKPTDLQSVIGKKAWVKQNLDLNKQRVQVRHQKAPFAQYNDKTGLLIDDFEKNIKAFKEAGGETIHFKNTSQAIGALKDYGFGRSST